MSPSLVSTVRLCYATTRLEVDDSDGNERSFKAFGCRLENFHLEISWPIQWNGRRRRRCSSSSALVTTTKYRENRKRGIAHERTGCNSCLSCVSHRCKLIRCNNFACVRSLRVGPTCWLPPPDGRATCCAGQTPPLLAIRSSQSEHRTGAAPICGTREALEERSN